MTDLHNAALLDKIGRVRKCEPSPDMLDVLDELEKVVRARVASATAADTRAHISVLMGR
jgi:hypothetical protein